MGAGRARKLTACRNGCARAVRAPPLGWSYFCSYREWPAAVHARRIRRVCTLDNELLALIAKPASEHPTPTLASHPLCMYLATDQSRFVSTAPAPLRPSRNALSVAEEAVTPMRRILLGCCNGCSFAGWRTPTPFPRALLEPVPVTHARNAGKARTAARIPAEHRYVPVLFSAHNLSWRTRTSETPLPTAPHCAHVKHLLRPDLLPRPRPSHAARRRWPVAWAARP